MLLKDTLNNFSGAEQSESLTKPRRFLESRDRNYDPAVKLFVSFIKTAETKIYFKILLFFTSFILMLLMAGVMLYANFLLEHLA